jgi:hypothetical protein
MRTPVAAATLCAVVALGASAAAEPEVLALPMPEFYTNGLLGVPAFGSFASLEYVPGTQLWPNIMLSKSWLHHGLAFVADSSPANLWIQSGEQVVVDRTTLPTFGFRWSYQTAGASRDARDAKLEFRCNHKRGGILTSECAADAAGAMLPGLAFSAGAYGQAAPFGRIDGLAGDAMAQATWSPLTFYVSGVMRWRGSYHDDFGSQTLEMFEVGGQSGAYYRLWGTDAFGASSFNLGVSARYLWSEYELGHEGAWVKTSAPDSFEGWASAAFRFGRVGLTVGVGRRWSREGPVVRPSSTLSRPCPVMLSLQYALE